MQANTLCIIVTYNGLQWIEKCINSILNSTLSIDIFLIDNGSTDGTIEYIQQHFKQPNIIFKKAKQNLGFGKANNIGFQFALEHNYNYIYLLNQDAWVLPNTIENLIGIQKMNPQYGILSPFQLQANEKHLDDIFGNIVCSWNSNKKILEDYYFGRLKEVYTVPFVMAAHWLISKDCLQRTGGFSPTFPLYGEDNNYIDRALYHGYKVGIVPQSMAIHDRENRQEMNVKQIIYRNYITNLVKLSTITVDIKNIWFKIIINELKFLVKYPTIDTVKYIFKLIFNYHLIKRNKINSREETAFL